MRTVFLFISIFTSGVLFAQKNQNSYLITYDKFYNDIPITDEFKTWVYTNAEKTIIVPNQNKASLEYPFVGMYVNRKDNLITHIAQLQEQSNIGMLDSLSNTKYEFEFTDETKELLGYTCQKAKTVVNSNRIDIWYTKDLTDLKGSPTVIGQNLGLVLEINRNGNYLIKASKIEIIKENKFDFIDINQGITLYDELSYKDLLWKSRFTTIPVFKNQILSFSNDEIVNNTDVFRYSKGTVAVKKVKFPMIEKGNQVFLELNQHSNGDAYDRTGSVFIIPVDKGQNFLKAFQSGLAELPVYENGDGKKYQGFLRTESYEPLIELMRFFTPFGIKQYNYLKLKDKNWMEKATYRQDISEFSDYLSNNEVYIGAFIGNYDKNGHKIDLEITIHKETAKQFPDKKIIPLFNTVNVMEMEGQEYSSLFSNSEGLKVKFSLDKDMKNTILRYTTTGHGGWENGDEFLQKPNTIYLNGKMIFNFIPWRLDCGSYRIYNPASGNFENGLSSSDYSRSNWCPGTLTNPEFIFLGDLSAGEHVLEVKIPQGKPEGNSFSAWSVSGCLIGE